MHLDLLKKLKYWFCICFRPNGQQQQPNGAGGGIAVTQISGNPYLANQHNQGYTPATLTPASLPQYPAPQQHMGMGGEPYINGGRQVGFGGNTNGYNGHFLGQQPTGQMAQPQVRKISLKHKT